MFDDLMKSRVSRNEGAAILFNDINTAELMANATFSQAVFLAVTKKMPDAKVSRMLDALLIAMIPETITSHPTACAKLATDAGAALNTALAAGVSAMDKNCGLHIQECMELFKTSIKDMNDINLNVDEQAEITVQHTHDRGYFIPGFGNKLNSCDQRVARLIEKTEEFGFKGNFVNLAAAIEKAYKNVFNLDMPLSLEALAAAILLEIGVEPQLGPAFFILSKIPCMCANIADLKGWFK